MEILDAGRRHGRAGRASERDDSLVAEVALGPAGPATRDPDDVVPDPRGAHHLDLAAGDPADLDGSPVLPGAPGAAGGPLSPGQAIRTAVGPDALGLAAFALAVTQTFGGGLAQSVLNLRLMTDLSFGPQDQAEVQAQAGLASAAVVTLLAVVSLLRTRHARTAWSAVVAGAALLLALVAIGLSAWMLWKAADLPVSY